MNNPDQILFQSFSIEKQKAWLDFQKKELFRHIDDAVELFSWIKEAEEISGLKASTEYVGKWIDIKFKD